jgi:hypothetical protein
MYRLLRDEIVSLDITYLSRNMYGLLRDEILGLDFGRKGQ